jgi:hypothetical protein
VAAALGHMAAPHSHVSERLFVYKVLQERTCSENGLESFLLWMGLHMRKLFALLHICVLCESCLECGLFAWMRFNVVLCEHCACGFATLPWLVQFHQYIVDAIEWGGRQVVPSWWVELHQVAWRPGGRMGRLPSENIVDQ